MLSMQQVQLRSVPRCGGQTRMRGPQGRRAFSCTRCQQQHDSSPEHKNTHSAMLDWTQKLAAIAAAALVLVGLHAVPD